MLFFFAPYLQPPNPPLPKGQHGPILEVWKGGVGFRRGGRAKPNEEVPSRMLKKLTLWDSPVNFTMTPPKKCGVRDPSKRQIKYEGSKEGSLSGPGSLGTANSKCKFSLSWHSNLQGIVIPTSMYFYCIPYNQEPPVLVLGS